MNKKIILSLSTTILLTTSSLFASPSNTIIDENNHQSKVKMMKQTKGKLKMMKIFAMLDLTNIQKSKIKDIVKKSKKDIPNPHNAFSETRFNKELFIKLIKEKKYGVIERKANLIENIYQILTESQKKDFKKILNMKELKQKRRM
jgi:Spy/CpxP family protein refolding chaperone